jgi:polynucleotide 5'-kinase involved in rRNA processing
MAPKPKARKSGPKGGRPSKMNPDKVRRVEEMKACGISDEAIAGELRVSRTTLLKHYAGALNKGRERRQAELNEIIWREARAGKSWAVKLLDAKMQAVAAEDSFLADDEPAPARKPKLG